MANGGWWPKHLSMPTREKAAEAARQSAQRLGLRSLASGEVFRPIWWAVNRWRRLARHVEAARTEGMTTQSRWVGVQRVSRFIAVAAAIVMPVTVASRHHMMAWCGVCGWILEQCVVVVI